MRDAEFLKIGDFLDQAGERARMLRTGGRMPRVAAHMDFINNRPVQRLGREMLSHSSHNGCRLQSRAVRWLQRLPDGDPNLSSLTASAHGSSTSHQEPSGRCTRQV